MEEETYGETNELRTGEGESRCDENGANSLEAICECSRVTEVLPSNVGIVRGSLAAAAVQYDAGDNEDDNDRELEARTPLQRGKFSGSSRRRAGDGGGRTNSSSA